MAIYNQYPLNKKHTVHATNTTTTSRKIQKQNYLALSLDTWSQTVQVKSSSPSSTPVWPVTPWFRFDFRPFEPFENTGLKIQRLIVRVVSVQAGVRRVEEPSGHLMMVGFFLGHMQHILTRGFGWFWWNLYILNTSHEIKTKHHILRNNAKPDATKSCQCTHAQTPKKNLSK